MVLGLGLVVVLVVAGVAFVGRLGRTRSTVARLHVDDLAIGAGPEVCVVTGAPTTHLVEVASTEGGFQGWWMVLVLFGPVGWVALIALAALARRPGRVSGLLPVSPEAHLRYRSAVRLSQRAMVVAGLVGITTLVVVAEHGANLHRGVLVAAGAAVLALFVVGLGATIVAPLRWFDLRLDGSGRWVTVERAHPEYAAAARRHNAVAHAR